jgi:GT2 family glycosyltransferase
MPPDMPTPRYSVLVCVHDRFDRLRECLRSLAACTAEATGQLVIVCDGTQPPPDQLAAEFPPAPGWTIRWITVPHGGPARARNAALPHLTGELILFLNDDVRFPPGLLAAHDRAHRRRPGHAVMGNTRWAPEVIDSEFMHWVAHHDSFYYLIPPGADATWEYFHTMNLSIDRRWFDGGARFDESFPYPAFEDTELGRRLAGRGLLLAMAYDAVLYHVHHFTPAQYVAKSRERGASARRFCALHPELTDRIISEYRDRAARESTLPRRLARLLRRTPTIADIEGDIAREFLAGWNAAQANSPPA